MTTLSRMRSQLDDLEREVSSLREQITYLEMIVDLGCKDRQIPVTNRIFALFERFGATEMTASVLMMAVGATYHSVHKSLSLLRRQGRVERVGRGRLWRLRR